MDRSTTVGSLPWSDLLDLLLSTSPLLGGRTVCQEFLHASIDILVVNDAPWAQQLPLMLLELRPKSKPCDSGRSFPRPAR
jgi:hypothetical protein